MKPIQWVILPLFFCLGIQSQSFSQDIAEENQMSTFGLNAPFSYDMMEHNTDLRKLDILRNGISQGVFENSKLVFGTSIIAIADYQHSNTDSKFSYLMRHPTSANAIGQNASEVVLHSAQISLAGAVNEWIHLYGELLYNPEQSFGQGTITSLERNRIEFRKGIIMLGNPAKSPFYLALGKMDTPFGLTGSVSPFSNSTMWHAFGGLAYCGVLGVESYGFNFSVAAVQGGAQFRAHNVPVDSTNVPSRVNNFTVDLNYTTDAISNVELMIGASYMKGSAYVQDFPVTHFSAGATNNPAYSYYGQLTIGGKLLLQGAFAETTEVWPGTHNPFPPLDVFEAAKVSSLTYGFKYDFLEKSNTVYSLSGEFSNFKAGDEGAPWERQNQIVAGLLANVNGSSLLFLEVFTTKGYAPLNFISGGNLENMGATHSVGDASSIGFVLGVQATL